MCGLVGFSSESDASDREKQAIQMLFVLNALRGVHGCGFFTYEHNPKDKKNYFFSDKTTEVSSSYAFGDDFYKYVTSVSGLRIFAGHSRHATVGKVTKNNNHPFATKNIIGMHNGTITGSFEGTKKYNTDSEALFRLGSEIGMKGAVEKVLEEANNAAFALAWYDKLDSTFNLVRNTQRPLHIAYHKRLDKLFWASERDFLLHALARSNILVDYEVKELPIRDLVTIKCATGKYEITKDFYTIPVKTYNYGTTTYNGWRWSGEENYSNKNKHFSEKYQKANGSNIIKPREWIKIGTHWHLEGVVLDSLEKGCCVCGNPTTIVNKKIDALFLPDTNGKEYVCSDCQDWMDKEEGSYESFGLSKSNLLKANYE